MHDDVNILKNNNFDKTLVPDLYSRNLIVSNLITSLNPNNNPIKILDVGGRNGQLDSFLPKNCSYTIFDIRESELNESNYIVGDITDSSIPSNSFDIVIALDFYEHLSESKRQKALSKILRISKNFVIIGGPYNDSNVTLGETHANNLYKKLLGKDNPWLEEHFKNNLPDKSLFENYLSTHNYDFTTFGTSNLENWLISEALIDYAYANGIENKKIQKLFEYYNKHILELGHFLPPYYRTIYLIGKKQSLPQIDNITKTITKKKNIEKFNNFLFTTFDFFYQVTQDKNIHIRNLESLRNQNDEKVSNMFNEIENLESTINKNSFQEKQKNELIEKQTLEISNTSTDLKNIKKSLSETKSTLSETQEYWADLLVYMLNQPR